jgi:hypothetical protein
MTVRAARGGVWIGAVALLVLVARWLCYALAPPNPLSSSFRASAGGPRLLVVALVTLALSAALSVTAVWLAALGVRERARLRPERVPPRLRLRRLALRATVLFAVSSIAFALFESYLHWRAGIGFHGLSCLVGPVHRNAIPVLAGLALLAAALAEAAGHLVSWARAAVRELLRVPVPLLRALLPTSSPWDDLASSASCPRARPRAPPQPV